jgi:hypothetical protein
MTKIRHIHQTDPMWPNGPLNAEVWSFGHEQQMSNICRQVRFCRACTHPAFLCSLTHNKRRCAPPAQRSFAAPLLKNTRQQWENIFLYFWDSNSRCPSYRHIYSTTGPPRPKGCNCPKLLIAGKSTLEDKSGKSCFATTTQRQRTQDLIL